MSRTVTWRRTCSAEVSGRINDSLQLTQYILNETGPTGFIVKQDGSDKKFKVLLGDPHSCTCNQFKKEKDLCQHILWILLKKFRVPKDNPMVYQLGLVEREIQEVLSGHLKVQSPKRSTRSNGAANKIERRSISMEDTCPICQESLMEERHQKRLTYCKYGCGNNVHLKCIKMWADHQKGQNESIINCPLCREKFSTFEELYDELHKLKKTNKGSRVAVTKEVHHLGITCSSCNVCPIKGKCFKCETCSDCFLCSNCFKTEPHAQNHPFLFKQNPDHIWRSVTGLSTGGVPARTATTVPSQQTIDDIQSRELTDNDYELLLNLDASPTSGASPSNTRIARVLNTFPIEPLDRFHRLIRMIPKRTCTLCNERYYRGDWIRRLPCKHEFHKDCVDPLLKFDEDGVMFCPLDGKVIYKPPEQPRDLNQGRAKPRRSKIGRLHENGATPLEPFDMLIAGHGISGRERELRTKPNIVTAITPIKRATGGIKKGTVMGRGINATNEGLELSVTTTPVKRISVTTRKRELAAKGLSSSLPQLSHDSHVTESLNSSTGSLPKLPQSHDSHMTHHNTRRRNDRTVLPPINKRTGLIFKVTLAHN